MGQENHFNLNIVSNLQTLENELALTAQEKEAFKKLPKKEQKKLNKEKLAELAVLNAKQAEILKEATETGDPEKFEEAKKIKFQVENGVTDLEEQVNITERIKLPEGAIIMEIIPDPEIISAETAITKLEKEGHKITNNSKDMLSKVNWKENLKDSYEIISISVRDLFGDPRSHEYADIKRKAEENGLDLVPTALAPEIRLNYPKSGSRTNIAMEAIRGRDGDLRLFGCEESWLSSNDGFDDYEWDDGNRFFFVRK